jgi:phosphatidylserine/phosphatidylglycerophosphate/cardiolipin synthase-like enzyme
MAEKFICISSWHNSLTKDLGMGKTLGELLVEAGKRGTKIYILIWDHCQSNKQSDIKQNLDYLKSVDSSNIFYKKSTRTNDFLNMKFLSHHQKILLTEKTIFINGMDFVPKAIDTREHLSLKGNRWHDVGSQAQGSIILDVFEMFDARWRSQVRNCMLHNSDSVARESLREHLCYLEEKISRSKLTDKIEDNSQESIQLLVSLSRSDYQSPHRMWPFKSDYTNEIHAAIFKSINKSKDYIFIANQYFIGQYTGHESSPNKISQALIHRILKAHHNHENFHVYFMLPSMPGHIEAVSTNHILRKQWKTIEYVISEINNITGNKAAQYITFTELGAMDETEEHYYQIYVHSKILFTPNEIYIGSANFNERSLAGNRDSETMLHIKGYHIEQAEFRYSIIEEFYGEEVLKKLQMENTLDNLGSKNAQKIILDNIDTRLKNLNPSAKIFEEKLKITPKKMSAELLGFAYPWGLIPRKKLMLGEKPPRVPEHESIKVSFINKLGCSNFTR